MVVSSGRFVPPFDPQLRVYTASATVMPPAGAKSFRLWALGGAGSGGSSPSGLQSGGGGGEMRILGAANLVAGQAFSLSVEANASTLVTYNGKYLAVAVKGGNGASSGGVGGSGGTGGTGRSGGNGAYTPSGGQYYGGFNGGGAAGTDGDGQNGFFGSYDGTYQQRQGPRGAGRSFTDSVSGQTYQNGQGGAAYGGGGSGTSGFVAIEWLGVEVITQTRVLTASGSVITPTGMTRAKIVLLNAGNRAGYDQYDDPAYDDEGNVIGYNTFYNAYDGSGGNMAVVEVSVAPGDVISYDRVAPSQFNDIGASSTYKNGQLVARPDVNGFSGSTVGTLKRGGGRWYGGGFYNVSWGGGGAAGTDGDGQSSYGNAAGGEPGPGDSFTDALSGVTASSGRGSQDFGGGGRWQDGHAEAGRSGFLAVIFSSI